ncbi:hypothetical protein DVW87_13950 [Sphingomonas aracearum]|uniref:Uncharacterized protein n=2 Tax=Sphingomonas aracearum TaxID=2283317 RepID=A0A369VQL6_9SPHN|nr:hypothetical protein DVW87_13950 [Sphingomonas aracearum]
MRAALGGHAKERELTTHVEVMRDVREITQADFYFFIENKVHDKEVWRALGEALQAAWDAYKDRNPDETSMDNPMLRTITLPM